MKNFSLFSCCVLGLLVFQVSGQSSLSSVVFEHPSAITTSHIIDNSVVVGYYQDGGWGVKSYELSTAALEYEVHFLSNTWVQPKYLFERADSLYALLTNGNLYLIDIEGEELILIDSLQHPEGDRHQIYEVFPEEEDLRILAISTQGPISFPTQRWNVEYRLGIENLSVSQTEIPAEIGLWDINAIKSTANGKVAVLYDQSSSGNNQTAFRLYGEHYLLEDEIVLDGLYLDFLAQENGYVIVGMEGDSSKIIELNMEGEVTSFYDQYSQGVGRFTKVRGNDAFIYALRNQVYYTQWFSSTIV
jgi:hypothetical protein